jgi:hypothetical protein
VAARRLALDTGTTRLHSSDHRYSREQRQPVSGDAPAGGTCLTGRRRSRHPGLRLTVAGGVGGPLAPRVLGQAVGEEVDPVLFELPPNGGALTDFG